MGRWYPADGFPLRSESFAYCLDVILMVFLTTSFFVFIWRRHLFPINIHGRGSLMITVGVAMQIQLLSWLTENNKLPCMVPGLIYMMSSQVELVVFFVRTWQLRCHLKVSESLDRQKLLSSAMQLSIEQNNSNHSNHSTSSNSSNSSNSSTGSNSSTSSNSTSQIKNWYLVNRRYFSLPFIKKVVSVHVTLIVAVVIISFMIDGNLQTTGPCPVPYTVLLPVALLFTVIGYGILLIITLTMRSVTKDAYGIKREFLWTFGCIFLIKLPYTIIVLVGGNNSEGTSIASIWKYWSVGIHYLAMTISSFVIPAWKTFNFHRGRAKTLTQINRENFNHMLVSDDEVQSFLAFLKSEFSAENLLFDLAVEEYRGAPTIERAEFIVRNYIQSNSIFEVNISDVTRLQAVKLVSELCASSSAEDCATVFDAAQKEIRGLMFRDSFPRFLAQKK